MAKPVVIFADDPSGNLDGENAKNVIVKIDRLIGILSILLQKDKITTQELANKFEVSRRTILRDIDALSVAGIPIISEKGQGGVVIEEIHEYPWSACGATVIDKYGVCWWVSI